MTLLYTWINIHSYTKSIIHATKQYKIVQNKYIRKHYNNRICKDARFFVISQYFIEKIKKEPKASIPQISYTLKRVKKCRNEGYLSSHPTGVGFGGSGIRRRVATLGYFWLSLSHALFSRKRRLEHKNLNN